ncbi:MAG TPA: TolC family outer membrane protein [Desulfobacterales bacterium]|nr:TolC family outer membrane protein [Desulfobacterales bacterium]
MSALLMLAGLLCIAPARGEDLLSVYRSALESSNRLQRVHSDLIFEQASRDEARAGLLPKLRGAATLTRNDTRIEVFGEDFAGSALPPGVFSDPIEKTHTGGSYSFRLIQPIVDAQAWSAVDASDARIAAGQAAVTVVEQNLILEVVDAYFTVLGAQADVRAVRSRRERLAETLARAETNLEAGAGDIIAVHEARAARDAAQADVTQSRNAVRIAWARLERLTHRPVGAVVDLGQIEARPPEPNRVSAWVRTAVEKHPLLRQTQLRLAAAQERIHFERRARWPQLDATAGYGYDKGSFLPSSERWQGSVGLAVTLRLYEGGAISARVRQAEARVASLSHRLQELADRIGLETESAFLQLEDSVARLAAAEQGLDSARVSLQATREGLRLGTRTIVDLLAAIEALEAAERSFHHARYQHVTGRIRLKAAAGVVAEKDARALNALLRVPSASAPRPVDEENGNRPPKRER